MDLLLEQVVIGLVSGAVLVLLALGLNLILGFMEVVNFAHGALYMLGAYVGVYLLEITGNFWWALFLVPIGMLAIGALLERSLIRPLYPRGQEDGLLLTFGLTYVLTEGVRQIAGAGGKTINPPAELSSQVPLGPISFPSYLVFVVVLVAAIVAGLHHLLRRTDLGLVIRAGVRDNLMVRALGISFDRYRIVVFGLGVALAGLAGVLTAPVTGVYPEMGTDILVTAFVVVVVGGLGSFWGAVVSGLLIGQAVSITTFYGSIYAGIAPFVLMILIMAFRPRGLMGAV
ncbi:MAG: branched-chain amino acid ABC transporter permease [Carbonactinosporaceae bacterium]